uniref:OB domain-containing protein n=1 Tax=Trichuris muris TaxID=70415 RepID=A0A5S6QUU9_TRIMR
MSDSKYMCIRELTANMRYISLQFIILEIGPPRRTRDGHDVRLIRIADQTGSVNLSAWDEIGSAMSAGDICKLANGYTSYHRGCLTVNCGKLGELRKIGEFCMLFSDHPNMSLPNPAETAKIGAEGNSRRLPPHTSYEDNVDQGEPQNKQMRLQTSNGVNALASSSSLRNWAPRDGVAIGNHAPQRLPNSHQGVPHMNSANASKLNRVHFGDCPVRPLMVPANPSAVVNARLPGQWYKEAGTTARN